MKIALVVGHNSRSRGSYSRHLGAYEYDFWGPLLDPWHDQGGCRVFRRQWRGDGYVNEIQRVYRQVDRWDADVSVEFHFNWAKDKHGRPVTGTETLSSGTRGSLALAELVQDAQLSYLDLRDRGVKVRGKGERGGRSLWAGAAPAVLVEPFFGNNPGDVRQVIAQGAAGLVEKIIKGI